MFLLSVLLLLTTALAIYIWRFYENIKQYPKGPRPYPFVGNLLSLNFTRIHEEFARCTKEYGNIFTVYLPKPHVVITDFDGVKEAFVKKGDDFLGRSGIFPDTIFQNVENGGVIFSQGENWREQRRASLHILRDFGMGKNLMEEQVLLSAQDFLAHLSSIKNKDEVCLREPIQVFIGNIINKTLYGFSYEYNKSGRMMDAANELTTVFEAMKKSPLTFVGQLFPIIYRLPIIGHLSKGRFEDMIAGLRRTIKEDVARALESYSVDQEPECLVQAYYQRMQNDSNLNYENLLNVCMDFYLAGMETTTTTLRWATLLFASHPEVQDKVREEILKVIGLEGKPTTSDRQKLPYTNAAIQELQRWANIVSMNVVHRTVRDTSVRGVKIPADTHVLGEIHQILAHSPVFKDGHQFRPERFLMEDGVTPNKEAIDHLCPFSMGKRQCAGEALARVELFVGVITLLQNYKIEPAKGRDIDLEPIPAGILLPKMQPLRLVPVMH
uniref:Unspecific monooxygenase n=1 Tax=Haemonchus contortus TaxID=6289 RepID=A0A7I4XZD3_HAECO